MNDQRSYMNLDLPPIEPSAPLPGIPAAFLAPGDDTLYDYEFSVWPAEGRWEPAVHEVFRFMHRIEITKTSAGFRFFRDTLEQGGFSLREVTRTPHADPEPVL
jgi:hypothetical protein